MDFPDLLSALNHLKHMISRGVTVINNSWGADHRANLWPAYFPCLQPRGPRPLPIRSGHVHAWWDQRIHAGDVHDRVGSGSGQRGGQLTACLNHKPVELHRRPSPICAT